MSEKDFGSLQTNLSSHHINRDTYKLSPLYHLMSDRIFLCNCQKCGAEFDFTGSFEKFNEFMDSKNFICPSGHTENRSPRFFLKVMMTGEPKSIVEWKPAEGRNYVNILDYQTARIGGMQIDHLGSGLYIDRRTGKKYDYEEDAKGKRHYFEVPPRLQLRNSTRLGHELFGASECKD